MTVPLFVDSGLSRAAQEEKERNRNRRSQYFLRGLLAGVLVLFGLSLRLRADSPSQIHWLPDTTDDLPIRVEVAGLTADQAAGLQKRGLSLQEYQTILSVRIHTGDIVSDLELPAIAGDYDIQGGRLVFVPAFGFRTGVRYRATLNPAVLQSGAATNISRVTSTFFRANPIVPSSTRVRAVYPGTDKVPENLLKFYLEFSAPMSRGGIYQYIHMRTAEGRPIELPFLEIDEELWDPAMQRLTLFLDPGRIKRGVRPLEEIGPALEAGGHYVLHIDRAWPDAKGAPLEKSFDKQFEVVEADRVPPEPATWSVNPPTTGTQEPLTVTFPDPMDHAITRRVFKVVTPDGGLVPGQPDLQDSEKRWVFVPDSPWAAGAHRIRFPNVVEDLAGNNIGKVFDVDLADGSSVRPPSRILELPFQPR